MSRDLPALWVALSLALCACGLLARDCATGAHGQDRPLSAQDRVYAAQCLVAEAGPGPDYLAILSVLARRGSLGWAATRYCAVHVTRHPSRRQSEIRMLPLGPARVRYARHWRAALEAVGAWEAGARPACVADHFGDRLGDARRARARGLVVVDCGRTANIFWRRP